MSDETMKADAIMVANFVLKQQFRVTVNVHWYDAEQAALRVLAHFGVPMPPRASGLY